MSDVRQRLDAILAAQSGRSASFGLTDADYFWVVGLYLSADDLAAVWPSLSEDPRQPRVGVGPRYHGVPVYEVTERPLVGQGYAEFRGVWFRYVPMEHVLG